MPYENVTTEMIRDLFHYGALELGEIEVTEALDAFESWLEQLQTDAYFRGAMSMSDQVFEDTNVPYHPHFISPFEDGDVDWHEWKRRAK